MNVSSADDSTVSVSCYHCNRYRLYRCNRYQDFSSAFQFAKVIYFFNFWRIESPFNSILLAFATSMKAQSAQSARSSLVKLRSVPQMTSSKSAVYLSLLIFRYMAVFRSRLSCTSSSTILEMATSRDGRFCTGRLVMASKEDDIPMSFSSLSCMMVSCKP